MERKTCLITGASGDIGEQIAKVLIHDGWQVVLHCNQNIDKLKRLIEESPQDSVLSIIQSDLTTAEGVKHLIGNLHFSIDAFIHAGGKALHELFQNTSEEAMNDMVQLHVLAPWKISKYLLPDMVRKRKGDIIMISSIWGQIGASHEVVYSSVKGAQNSFVKALAKEVANSNIRVNAVSPGLIDTKMNKHLEEDAFKELLEEIPANKAGTPEDVANLVHFLLSSKSAYINGQIIGVNGAWS